MRITIFHSGIFKKWDVPPFFVIIVILFLMPGIVNPRGYEVKRRAGEYETEVKIDRYPPVLGDNGIEIEIKDARGNPITDAKVLVNYLYAAYAKNGAHELHHRHKCLRPLALWSLV